MHLKPDHYRDLHAALLDAYPGERYLALFVRAYLGLTLDDVAPPGRLSERIAALIEARERLGPQAVIALVSAAHEENAGNPEIARIAGAIDASWFDAMPRPATATPAGSGSTTTIIDTGGGAYIGGNVKVRGSFVGRDSITTGGTPADEEQ